MGFEKAVRGRMASRFGLLGIGCAMAGLGAVASAWQDFPRVVFGCGVLATVWGWLAWRLMAHLSYPVLPVVSEPVFGAAPDLVASRKAVLALETQLEFAPVALWRISGAEVQPLNGAARRILAPGAALDAVTLFAQLRDIPVGQRSLIAYDSERGQERALVSCAVMQLGGVSLRMLAMLSIESELETQTLQAWRQLVHVLTHEIMNSLTPIASLSVTAQDMLLDSEAALQHGLQEDLGEALQTIARRARHLVEFVDSYRTVSQWPDPKMQVVALQPMLQTVEKLICPDWVARGGSVRCTVEPVSLELMADPSQLEQVLINLAKNALEACADTHAPHLEIVARLARGGCLAMEVSDNGPGVEQGLETRIFTPFFTTRAHGSGIGLTVVRNLVHGMGGTVRYAKRLSGGACFILTF